MEINLNNVYQIIDVADKYFMTQVKRSIHAFIPNNLSDFVQSEHFLNLDKSILKEIVESFPILSEKEVLFEAVYKWAENQAIKKQRLDETLNLNETIKEEFSHVFPFVRIGKMDLDFIVKFVWQKSFLFSDEELKKLILDQSKVHVIIIDGDTKVMKGVLQCPDMEKVIDVIREQTFCVSRSLYYYWDAKQPKPSTPSKLNKDESIEWYLLYDKNGNLAIKHCDEVLDDDYLLAEMFADQDFGFHGVCKIQIV
uniref:BACK domain-containing protein n=1 Tax=Panagrolaimus superbus TaxID=310955 RepID=A0A914Y2D4_9BILA